MYERNFDRGDTCLPFTLTLIFMVLKLFHVIHWSWVWVFSPLWISFAITFVLLFFAWFVEMMQQ